MINDYFIDCELYQRTQTTDPMGGKIWTYTKQSDIKGVMYHNTKSVLIEGVYKYINESVFITKESITKDKNIKYEGQMYKIVGNPINIMNIGHHNEIKVELVDDV